MRKLRATVMIGCLLSLGGASAEPLPSPLSLDHLLALVDGQHPAERLSQAGIQSAEADLAAFESGHAPKLDFTGRLRWVDPNDKSSDQRHNDSQATLRLSKKLFDFGSTEAGLTAARARVETARLKHNATVNERVLTVLKRFLAVIEADHAATAATENMTMGFLDADKSRERHELLHDSDLTLAGMDANFHAARLPFIAAGAKQRTSRALLANELNRPGEPPGELLEPDFKGNDRVLPELFELVDAALKTNPDLVALQAEVAAAQAGLGAAEKRYGPSIEAELEANHWKRDQGGRDYWRGGLVFKMPLLDGGMSDSAVAKSAAEMTRVQAQLDAKRNEVRQSVIEAYEEVARAKAALQRADIELEYRELDLDRARGEYELEFRTDLGDSQVRFIQARLLQVQARHALALAHAELDALTGAPIIERLKGIDIKLVDRTRQTEFSLPAE